MPRRRVLTEAQLETLFALPTTEADLALHWTLSPADHAAIQGRRGDHNRLGFTLQLCALRALVAQKAQLPPERSRTWAEQEHRRRHRQTAPLNRCPRALTA